MVVGVSSLKTDCGIRQGILAGKTVMVIDRDFHARRAWTAELEAVGFGLILTAGDFETARLHLRQTPSNMFFIDPHTGADIDEGFDFIRRIRSRFSEGIVAVLTGAPSLGLCYRAVRAGVSDFLVKGPYLSIATEALRLIESQSRKSCLRKREPLFATGLFSSVGITRGELAILEEFANGFPKQQDIAKRLDKDEVYVRKVFSRVYKKMESYFPVNNQAQLSHIMTICSLFE